MKGSIGLVTLLISSSTCLLSMSSVFFTNKVHFEWPVAQCAKLRNLRVIYL
jgi:hypothetical protein